MSWICTAIVRDYALKMGRGYANHFFLFGNSNPKVIHLLKEFARRSGYEWGRVYGYADYEKLWKRIDRFYG